MDKELPTSGSGRSAFTVFGFGATDRYANFDSPLETAANVESFNATNSIAFPSRPTLKSKKQTSVTGSAEDVTVFAQKTEYRYLPVGSSHNQLFRSSRKVAQEVIGRSSCDL
ncbi:hypothetical protein RRG08_055507 [Elysia crispata]|uniref:Uncharacterized protein n=1 Tax=Elysia crispata TaxID=231223 RepID=A0AAE1AIG6_9GAST|nr:hypothetical protein RRG08_055507 [Elysia crispata]